MAYFVKVDKTAYNFYQDKCFKKLLSISGAVEAIVLFEQTFSIKIFLWSQKQSKKNCLEKVVKGQLISKFPFGVIVWTKIPTIFFPGFLP